MQPSSKYRSKVYRDFRAIGPGEWQSIVRFYEEHEQEVRALELEEYFEMLCTYTRSLYEVGAHREHVLMADVVVEACVAENVGFLNGEDVFRQTLFRKASSHCHCHELDSADHVLRELIRIDPLDEAAVLLLKKCRRKMVPRYRAHARAAALLLFFASAFVICVEMLVVRSFYNAHAGQAEQLRNGLFLLGLALLAAGELVHRYKTDMETDRFVEQAFLRKKKKEADWPGEPKF